MKNFLFPRSFQPIGWILFTLALIAGALTMFSDMLSFTGIMETVANDAIIIGIALGAVFIVCSKEKVEDEMTKSIRLASLLNSLYVYVVLLFCSTILINGVNYFWFMIVNLVLFPIIFVILFRLEMHSYNKLSENEEQN